MPRPTPDTRAYTAVLGLAVLCYLALGAVLPALPHYVANHLGGGPVAVGLSIGAIAISGAALRPPGGRWADRFGPRRVVIAGAVTVAAGGVAGRLAGHTGVPALVASRLLAGAGEAAMMSATVTWLLHLAPPDRRGRALGHIGLANYLGLVSGPLVAALIGADAGHIDRAWAIAIAAPLLAAGLATRVADAGPAEPARARARPAPLIERDALVPGAGLALVNVGYACVISFAGLAFEARGLSGSAIVPVYAGITALVRIALGSVPDRLGGRRTLLAAAPTAAAGLALAALAHTEVLAIAAIGVAAAGQALAVPALGLLAFEGVTAERRGSVAGSFFMFFDVGVGGGGPLLGALSGLAGRSTPLVAGAACSLASGFPAVRQQVRRVGES